MTISTDYNFKRVAFTIYKHLLINIREIDLRQRQGFCKPFTIKFIYK